MVCMKRNFHLLLSNMKIPSLISSLHSLRILDNVDTRGVAATKCRLQLVQVKHVSHYSLALGIVSVDEFHFLFQFWLDEVI